MIEFLTGDIFESKAEVLICPVNCVGSLGGGLAKQFDARSKDLASIYTSMCGLDQIKPGHVYPVDADISGRQIWLFATKDNWRHPSQLEWIDLGLQALREQVAVYKVTSLALPAIGCGLGGLRWRDVSYLIQKYFGEFVDSSFSSEVSLSSPRAMSSETPPSAIQAAGLETQDSGGELRYSDGGVGVVGGETGVVMGHGETGVVMGHGETQVVGLVPMDQLEDEEARDPGGPG